jgi:hypothetical protein
MNVSHVVGMPKKDAQNFAEMNNLIFRVLSVDDMTFLGEPPDVREDRLCVKIVKNKVVEANIK